MQNSRHLEVEKVVTALQKGGIAVVRTDTLYGIIARAHDSSAVAKVYTVKKRDPLKQCIVLVSNATLQSDNSLTVHGPAIKQHSQRANRPTSVIVPASHEPKWLLGDTGDSMAYRLVRDPLLVAIIERVGPVIAPSANPEGMPPARTIQEARQYFGKAVDYYADGGEVHDDTQASRLIKLNPDGTVETLRS